LKRILTLNIVLENFRKGCKIRKVKVGVDRIFKNNRVPVTYLKIRKYFDFTLKII
jgi:ASC-1-like (ASCH) protein